jgi:hypothetical protein
MDILDKLPRDLISYIGSFLFPREIDEYFDVRVFPVKKINAGDIEKYYLKYLLAARRLKTPFIVYNRFQINLENNAPSLELTGADICKSGIHIIDTLIFSPDTDYFYCNGLRLPLRNGVYNPMTQMGIQWFFAACVSWLTQVVISPCPLAIIGGFITPALRKPRPFDIKATGVCYQYEHGGCFITA